MTWTSLCGEGRQKDWFCEGFGHWVKSRPKQIRSPYAPDESFEDYMSR